MKQIFLSILFGILVVGCSPLVGSKSHVKSSQEIDTRKQTDHENARACDYEFTKVGLCASLTPVPNHPVQNPGSQIYFQIRFWNPSHGHSFGPYLDPKLDQGLDVALLPRKCAACKESFRASLEDHQNASEGAVFQVIPSFMSSGDYNMVIELQKDGQTTDQASVRMKISVAL